MQEPLSDNDLTVHVDPNQHGGGYVRVYKQKQEDVLRVVMPDGVVFRVNRHGHVVMWGAPLYVWFWLMLGLSALLNLLIVWLVWG